MMLTPANPRAAQMAASGLDASAILAFAPVSAARRAMEWTRGRLDNRQREFLAALPLLHRSGEVLFVHADASKPPKGIKLVGDNFAKNVRYWPVTTTWEESSKAWDSIMQNAVLGASRDEQLALIRAHPELAGTLVPKCRPRPVALNTQLCSLEESGVIGLA